MSSGKAWGRVWHELLSTIILARFHAARPVDFEQFLRVVQSLADYWFTVVVLPSAQGGIEAKAVASVGRSAEILRQ
jgi:hypothetical protein